MAEFKLNTPTFNCYVGITPQMYNWVDNSFDYQIVDILVTFTETGAAGLEFFKIFSSII